MVVNGHERRRRAREEPENHLQVQASVNGRMLKRDRVAMAKWQEAWTTEVTGRHTERLIHHVDVGLRRWSPRGVCLLTEHCPFKAYFRRFNFREGTGECGCGTGEQETAYHLMEECQGEEQKRSMAKFRRRQQEVGGTLSFQVTKETKEEEIAIYRQDEETEEEQKVAEGNNDREEEE